jgi:hypothetical protein
LRPLVRLGHAHTYHHCLKNTLCGFRHCRTNCVCTALICAVPVLRQAGQQWNSTGCVSGARCHQHHRRARHVTGRRLYEHAATSKTGIAAGVCRQSMHGRDSAGVRRMASDSTSAVSMHVRFPVAAAMQGSRRAQQYRCTACTYLYMCQVHMCRRGTCAHVDVYTSTHIGSDTRHFSVNMVSLIFLISAARAKICFKLRA